MTSTLPYDATNLTEKLFYEITSSWRSQAIAVAAHIGLADVLGDETKSVEELAAHTHTDILALRRLLKALTTLGICEGDDMEFSIAPLGRLLRTEEPGGLRHWAIWWGMHLGPVWQQLLYSVQTGRSARSLLTGKDGFEHLEHDSQTAATFNLALGQLNQLIEDTFLRLYDFQGVRTLMDVGGGSGQMLKAILKAHPAMSGVLFDLPHALQIAEISITEARLKARCRLLNGDFFHSVEHGADAYMLKSVLHDWNDDKCLVILRNCRRATSENSRLLIIEQMLPDRLMVSAEHQSLMRSDLNMLVAFGGAERTEAELRMLLQTSGFVTTRILPLGATFTLIEAAPSAHRD